jgi:hypothetical protein
VKTVPITCPNCGSADLAKRDAEYQCNHCGSFFRDFLVQGAPPPIAPSSSSRKVASFPIIMIGLLGGMMLVGAIASVALRRTPPEPPPPPETQIIGIDTPPPPSGIQPRAELGAKIDGTTSIGGRFWLIDYRNVGEVEITNAAVAVSLFDSDGARVGEQSGYATVKRLQPGKSTTILVLFTDPTPYARSEIQLVTPESSTYGLPEVELSVSDFRETNATGSLRDVIGTIKNPNKRQVRFVNLLIVGRDAQGQPVSFATGIPTEKEIDAGGESGFSVGVGTFEIEPPSTWEVTVVGSPL